jgi:ATP-dependent RNA helicase DeaD
MTDYSGIVAPLASAIAKRGYTELTPVQRAVLDDKLNGADALVSAQTGSGKTVAFGLAIAPTLLGEAERFLFADTPLALVVTPTRELALQVKRELDWLYAETGAQVASCVGGMDYRTEKRALERGAHIVVGTPGRLKDHIERNSLDLSNIRAVVLDEADEMLDMGFSEDLEFILSKSPESRRTLMFSATVPREIATLAKKYQRDAVRIQTASDTKQHVDIEYRALSVAPYDRENAIINVLRYYEAKTAIVFCTTRAAVNHLMGRFQNRGFAVVALSGEFSQTERTHALQAMRDGRARVCIATDVAARGIDLPGLELVIHADLPTNSETLLHRSGRTGRAGNKGVSALIVTPKDFKKAQRLLQGARLTATWDSAPTADQVNAKDDERLLDAPVLGDAIEAGEMPMIEALIGRYGAETVAAGFVRLWRAGRSAPEELHAAPSGAPAEVVRRPRDEFGDSTWFSISVGRTGRAEARWLLPKLCDQGQITKNEIGAIRVQEDVTYVQIAAQATAGFLKALGAEMALEAGVVLTRLASEPTLARPERKPYGEKPERKPYAERAERKPYAPRSEAPVEQPVEAEPVEAKVYAAPVEPVKKAYVAPAEAPSIDGKKAYRASKYENREPFKPARRVGVKPARRDDGDGADGAARVSSGYKGKTPYAKTGDAKPFVKGEGKPYARKDDSKPYGKPAGKAPYKGGEGKGAGKPWEGRAERSGDARPSSKPYAGKPGGSFGEGKPAGKGFASKTGSYAGKGAAKPAKPAFNAADTSQRMKPRSKPKA